METEKVHLTKEKETYLATLYGKALDSRSKNPILGDYFADEVVRHIDYDFEKLKIPKGASITLPMRAKHLDQWTREFLNANPVSTVLHLGCGLDSRVFQDRSSGYSPLVRCRHARCDRAEKPPVSGSP